MTSQDAGSLARSASMSGSRGQSESGHSGLVGSAGSVYVVPSYWTPAWDPDVEQVRAVGGHVGGVLVRTGRESPLFPEK
ncbi:hypothetical protein [Mycolicibacterium neworleansense]|uniref:hypothetical protein n=1 Tax=Mycolicibacterium neworleansense TaxID=146018 RepID=UPI000AD5E114|nr:hypothetical protein [Mycolicibacterium neworleansense]MCV7363223.1 hypothetical protein [Mycolicibacterium neworleansense]